MIGPKQQKKLRFPEHWDDARKKLYQRMKNEGPIKLANLLKRYKREKVPEDIFQATEDVVKHIFKENGIDFERFRKAIYKE